MTCPDCKGRGGQVHIDENGNDDWYDCETCSGDGMKTCSCKKLYPGWVCVSPSQIKTKRDCKRKWAFDKIDRIKRTSSAGQAFGTDVHSAGENWYRFKTRPPKTSAGQVFEQGIGKKDFLPHPAKGMLVEQHFVIELPELDKVLLHGYIDLLVPHFEQALVIDYKYTKNRKWIPTLEELESDPQVLIYAAAGLWLCGSERVETRWCYFISDANRKKAKGTTQRGIVWSPENLEFDQIIDDAAELAEIRRTVKAAKDVEPNYAACQKFGGCEYKNICPRTGSKAAAYIRQDDRFKANKEQLTKLNTGEK